MVILSDHDMFEVRVNSLLADYDRDTLTNLYQPIIGFTALALYFTLWSEADAQKVLSFSAHEQLFMRMKLAPGKFIEARKLLEAVGLVSTKLEKVSGGNIYHYTLNAPKTPKGFFEDTLLYGMLIQNLGEADANRTKSLYQIKLADEEGEDISVSFNEVFHPDFKDAAFLSAAGNKDKVIGRNKAKAFTDFSWDVFFEELGKLSQITSKSISKKEMQEVERLSTLYGVDEAVTAEMVANAYDVSKDKGERIDFDVFNEAIRNASNYTLNRRGRKSKSQINSDTDIANKINLFEKTSPKDILRILQGGTRVASSDLRIIEMLATDYNLSNGVINVIIDFVLSMNKNVLSRAYTEKIAASFNSEGIETTLDAMNYCNSIVNNKPARKGNSAKAEKSVATTPKKNASSKVSKEEWDALFEESEDKDDGKIESELPF